MFPVLFKQKGHASRFNIMRDVYINIDLLKQDSGRDCPGDLFFLALHTQFP